MLQKIFMLLIVGGLMLFYDLRDMKNQARSAKLAYTLLMAVSGYLILDYLIEPTFPSLDEAVNYILGKPAKWIVDGLKSGKGGERP